MNTTEIIDFFRYLNQLTDKFITAIELKPINVKDDIYISGFRRVNLTQIEIHIKRLKQHTIKTNNNTIEINNNDNPIESIWLNVELVSKLMLRIAFNQLRENFFKLNTFQIAELTYKIKQNDNTQEEIIIYEDKRTACKETIMKRKNAAAFKSNFIHWGTKQILQPTTTTITDEDFADMKLE